MYLHFRYISKYLSRRLNIKLEGLLKGCRDIGEIRLDFSANIFINQTLQGIHTILSWTKF